MRPFLSTKQLQTLSQAVIVLALDYCNALYYGCSHNAVISQLQLIQNRACRVVFGLRKRERIEQHMKELHWLKIQERIEFKIILNVFKCINGRSPSYLSELLQINRSRDRGCETLLIPNNIPERCFSYAGPKLWHGLPNSIKELRDIDMFKRRLKTYLFSKSYNIN